MSCNIPSCVPTSNDTSLELRPGQESPSQGLRACTRLAPSPTGALHLGNALAFTLTYLLARKLNWSILLRIEDLDGPRIKKDSASSIISTLTWLGISWDQGPILQSDDTSTYIRAMQTLASKGKTYPSTLTRSDIAAHLASAPNLDSGESVFPPSLRPADFAMRRNFAAHDEQGNPLAWRFVMPSGTIHFFDHIAGPQAITPIETIGDCIIWTKQAVPAYQLAVVVDDHAQNITHIVRGSDLLDSAARQIALAHSLFDHNARAMEYYHLPLLFGPDRKRLAKRHGDSRIDTYRALGVSPEKILGLIAHYLNIDPATKTAAPRPISMSEMLAAFDPKLHLPKLPLTFTSDHHQWLIQE